MSANYQIVNQHEEQFDTALTLDHALARAKHFSRELRVTIYVKDVRHRSGGIIYRAVFRDGRGYWVDKCTHRSGHVATTQGACTKCNATGWRETGVVTT